MNVARNNQILQLLEISGPLSSGEIVTRLTGGHGASVATVKRALVDLLSEGLIQKIGVSRSTKYVIAPSYALLRSVEIEAYYKKEIDEREILQDFQWALIRDILPKTKLFTSGESALLGELQDAFSKRVSGLGEAAFKKEMERLAIDLSWKSSQIEGNTYSLLETERLLREKQTADGKTKEEAVMLLNHKDAIDFITDNEDYLNPLSPAAIENIHSLLVKELGVDRNIRTRRVGISGTNYRPLDNEFQIKEAVDGMCALINAKDDVFEKALLALALISYIQPFMDGNKRTARIVSNAVLMGHGYCPISFRTVDTVWYKQAMLLFYEQNNISCFKQIFIDQFAFAVNTYF